VSRRRNNLVTFQARTEPADHFTEEDGDWDDAFDDEPTSYVEVHPMRGEELFQAQTTFGSATHKVTRSYKAGITSKMRILWGSRILQIVGIINPREGNRSLELMCKELV
jgi:SPP1 family predicted phage head-tail adaptor